MTKECGLEAVATLTGHQRDLCFYVADVVCGVHLEVGMWLKDGVCDPLGTPKSLSETWGSLGCRQGHHDENGQGEGE